METKTQNKYSFISQVLILFAFDVLYLIITTSIVGDDVKKISNMYQLGSTGIAISTMLQFLLSSVVIITLKALIFSTHIFKKTMTIWRSILLLLSVLVSSIIFIIIFDWFPLNNTAAWISFLLCFGCGFIICTSYMIIRTKLQDRRYNKLLSIYKNEHRGVEEDE